VIPPSETPPRQDCLFPFGDEVGDKKLSPTLHGCSERLDLECDLIPAFSRVISSFFVCANGIISVDAPFHLHIPQHFPGDRKVRDQLLFAPFWVDVDIRQEGNVWYGFHKPSNVTKMADDLIHQLSSEHSDFKTELIFVATWEKVPNYPDGSPDGSPPFHDERSSFRNTFQATIITDFRNTFLVYCYSDIEFTGREKSAEVGYSAGDGREFINHKGSLTEDIIRVSQFMTGNFTGLLFFHLTDTAQNDAALQCQSWYCDDKERFGDQQQWIDFLAPCPWTLSHAEADFRYLPVHSLRKNESCLIKVFPLSVSVGSELLTPETECCYTVGVGSLSLSPSLGGSASPYHRFSRNFLDQRLHDQLTVQPFKWCCLESNNCHLYFERRPSIPSSFYLPPKLGWAFGDPHIQTLDGKSYTFNGYGEYILIKTKNETFVLQGRTEPTGKGRATATVFIAFAMALFPASDDFTAQDPFSTVLHVQLTADNTLQVLARHLGQMSCIDITSNFTELNNVSTLLLDQVSVSRPNNVTLEAQFSSGISIKVQAKTGLLAVLFAGPVDLIGETRGLLGVWDNNVLNDFTVRKGTILPPNATDRTIHFDFGQSWQVTSQETLFCYLDGLGPNDFSFPEAVPLFNSELNLTGISLPLITVCGGNEECLFDGLVTGNIEVAKETLATEETNEADVSILENIAPVVNGNNMLFAFVNQTTIYSFTVTDVNDTFTVVLQGTPPPVGEYAFSNIATPRGVYEFTWTPTTTQSVSIQFLVTDSAGAATLLHPLVRLCACHQELNASCTDSTGDAGEDNFLIQSCTCGSGYGGAFCNVDVDGCDLIDCFPGVECMDNPAPQTGATCGECPDGTITRDNSCEDINECQSNVTNVCEQICVNTVGSFSCSCNAGFILNKDVKSCDDIDECEDNFLCHQICNNTVGSFVCDCEPGFQLRGDVQTCEVSVANRCMQLAPCEQLCAVVQGVEQCFCDRGFQLVNNSRNCSGKENTHLDLKYIPLLSVYCTVISLPRCK
jgi:fibulin 1/2